MWNITRVLESFGDKETEIRINDQWRICFRWGEGSAHQVTITDYY
jgi:proteic killer suppression protein